MSNSFWVLPIATIEKALAIRKQIESLKKAEKDIMGGGSSLGNGKAAKRRGRPSKTAPVESAIVNVDGRKGKRSAATIAKMKAAAKARWAKKNGGAPAAVKLAINGAKKKRTMSPEGRARIVAAQKARWAKKNGASTTPAPATSAAKAPKKRKTMSPEAREKIAAAQRARWAKQKAA